MGLLRGQTWATSLRDPTFTRFLLPALLVTFVVYSRSPGSNYIFDEQEALLANAYLTGDMGWLEAFRRDFWGLEPERTIGSYRPLPNLLWRALWWPSLQAVGPWLLHLANLVGHAMVAACLASFAFAVTGARLIGWTVGGTFLLCAVLTEAVTGVVGLADVLAGLGVVVALQALRLPLAAMPFAVFGALVFGFAAKESVLATIPLVGVAAVATASSLHARRPRRWLRGLFAFTGAVAALIVYTQFRKAYFPAPPASELAQAVEFGPGRVLHEFMAWFQQPKLPKDPMNNPLLEASTGQRIAGGLGVYAAGVLQLLFPWSLSGDYSFPQQPVPSRLWSLPSILGAILLVGPVSLGVWLFGRRETLRSRFDHSTWMLVALGLVWMPLAYFPHSNLLVLLPTVRAERFWYLPAIGSSLVVGVMAAYCVGRRRAWAWAGVCCYFGIHTLQARSHALHYSDDLVFWRATRTASPRSAKAHLNHSIMIGARGDLEGRARGGREALRLAPEWGMAHVYQGDVLCRLGRIEEAWGHYELGFKLAPSSPNQIALGLQCLWDRGAIDSVGPRLLELSEEHRGTWLGYLASDIVHNGERHGGVDPKYRPRGYNQMPHKSSASGPVRR